LKISFSNKSFERGNPAFGAAAGLSALKGERKRWLNTPHAAGVTAAKFRRFEQRR